MEISRQTLVAYDKEEVEDKKCGLRKGRGYVDRIFPLQSVSEKCLEKVTLGN